MVEAVRRYSSLEYRKLGRWTPALARVRGRDGNSGTAAGVGGDDEPTASEAEAEVGSEGAAPPEGEGVPEVEPEGDSVPEAAGEGADDGEATSDGAAPEAADGEAADEDAGDEAAGEVGDVEAPDGVGEGVVGARGPPKPGGGPRTERGRPLDGVAGGDGRYLLKRKHLLIKVNVSGGEYTM
nr:circumsporozoite protein-like [Aegilops tauschii subsp. strangulata]